MAKKINKIKKNCRYCNKIFYIYPAWARRGEGIYCSRKCFLEGYKRPTPLFKRICRACKKIFWVSKEMESAGTRRYCSRKCMGTG